MKRLFFLALFALSPLLGGAEKIVSLSPNLTEIIFQIGAGDQLVGRSSSCDYPPEVKSLPVVGRFGVPNLEPLLLTRPTLVVSETLRDDNVSKRLRELGIRYEEFPARDFDDYFITLKRLGKLLNQENNADREIREKRKLLAQWEAENRAIPAKERPKVLVIIGVAPIITAGKNSFLTRFIELAGGCNVAGEVEQSYFACSFEQIQLWQVEVILAPGLLPEQLQLLEKSPTWSNIPAVKNKKFFTDFNADLLYRLGSRSFDGIEKLRNIIMEK
ncbi:MAG: helical backbone metal receptor [Victivallales bacterium]|jgi:iron complex transport system substrate-binding protein|nr:helical backbone metal receptor [Victivallales bacterium]